MNRVEMENLLLSALNMNQTVQCESEEEARALRFRLYRVRRRFRKQYETTDYIRILLQGSTLYLEFVMPPKVKITPDPFS